MRRSLEYTLDDSGDLDVDVERVFEQHVHDGGPVLAVLLLQLVEADALGGAVGLAVDLSFFLQTR